MPYSWCQHSIVFHDRDSGQRVITDLLGPALRAAYESRALHGWWFMNKQPWPLRYPRDNRARDTVTRLLDQLAADGQIVDWTDGIYEPETAAFGGQAAMHTAHELFHHDSRHLLNYPPFTGHLGRRETAVVLCSAMMRAAGLDWYEQGDVWDKISHLRPAGSTPAQIPRPRDAATMRRLMTVNTSTLCTPSNNGPLAGLNTWVSAFENAGRELANLSRRGQLERGLRAVIAHHFIFHANRAGLSTEDQSAMSALAKEIVMGSSDRSESIPAAAGEDTSVPEVSTDTIEANDTAAERLRNALVDQVVSEDRIKTPRIIQAMRTVPRHLFVPEASLEDAYANTTVHIKYNETGQSISCASQPSVVGLMLEQLQPQPGERILELGAGTGYNAALLAHLVGEKGHVTTIDVDDDLVEGARAHLAAAGVDNVTVALGDGALGHADSAPYDKIIATVGAHGIPHAWLEQLAQGGRLLVPQRLRGSVNRSISYERRGDSFVSVSSEMNTFMPLRRGVADDDRPLIPVSATGAIHLQTNTSQAIDATALADVLDQPSIQEWTGVLVRGGESPEWMELWLTLAMPSGLNWMSFDRNEVAGKLLTDDPYPSSTAVFDKSALTYLARRLSDQTTPEGGKLWEFGVIGHGPGSDELAARVATAIQEWDRDYRGREADFELRPLDAAPAEPQPGRFTIDTPLNQIVIKWQ
ncbi:methyltransferase, FxLD system [Streptomyces sp. LHD-70]|uniref:methyltransferase, FxLD system n=1 Tax=Streptomyces sp. LHD-70 TaxID=3072140 RepID=UPI00280DA56B|nr:methyltransferase, FxLD system [Streptomyces sp. LHD-70]MDQ8706949.1 methyltransferase, FxLD system [Streptomyces sp. LHD-70]